MWPFTTKNNDTQQKDETVYGTEQITEKEEYTIQTVEIEFKDETIKSRTGVLSTRSPILRVHEIDVEPLNLPSDDNRYTKPEWVVNRPEIYRTDWEDVKDMSITNRRTLIIEGEAEVNYKIEDGEKTYTSIKNSELNRRFEDDEEVQQD